jgi:hypothetical protein
MAAALKVEEEEDDGVRRVHLLNIRGVPVEFPFEPYPSQLTYMEKVIESLQEVRVRCARAFCCGLSWLEER